jgi:peroxiredoxin
MASRVCDTTKEIAMPFRNKLSELEATFNPIDDRVALKKAVEQLIAKEQRHRLAKVGDIAPPFALRDAQGTLTSSTDLLEKGALVVTFYRGLWCPYCQHDLLGFRDVMTEVVSLGASVAAISHRSMSRDSRTFSRTANIGFPLLEDEDGDVAVRFGIRWAPDDFDLIQEKLGDGLTGFRGTEPWIIPMQARYVIGPDGIIAFAETAFDYSQRSEPAQVLPVLSRLKNAG